MIETRQYARSELLAHLRRIPFNTYFAEAVLRGQAHGRIYADLTKSPSAYLIANSCGMSLLMGKTQCRGFGESLRGYLLNFSGKRQAYEFLQVHPGHWATDIRVMVGGQFVHQRQLQVQGEESRKVLARHNVVQWGRLNFQFSREGFLIRKRRPLPPGFRVEKLGAEHFSTWTGAVSPRRFWARPDDYARRATAFGVWHGDELVSLAFSAFVLGRALEIGVETKDGFRGLGLAARSCEVFIEHCLAHGLEPVWSCRKGNLASQRTAENLGFHVTREIPYFELIAK